MGKVVRQEMRDGKPWPPLSHWQTLPVMGMGGIGCMGHGDPVGCDEHRPPGVLYPYEMELEEDDA